MIHAMSDQMLLNLENLRLNISILAEQVVAANGKLTFKRRTKGEVSTSSITDT